MSLSCYLMNSSKQEYTYIGEYDPRTISKYLVKLESRGWDIRNHNIFVLHSEYSGSYKKLCI
jgi:hypothetical protein